MVIKGSPTEIAALVTLLREPHVTEINLGMDGKEVAEVLLGPLRDTPSEGKEGEQAD